MRPVIYVDVRALAAVEPQIYDKTVKLEPYFSEICESLRKQFPDLDPEFRFFAQQDDRLFVPSDGSELPRCVSLRECQDQHGLDFFVDMNEKSLIWNLYAREDLSELLQDPEQPSLVVSPDKILLGKLPHEKCEKLRVAAGGELQGLLRLDSHSESKIKTEPASLEATKKLMVFCDIDDTTLMNFATFESGRLILNEHLLEYLKNLGRRFPNTVFQLITSRSANGPLETREFELPHARNCKAQAVLDQLAPILKEEGFQVAQQIIFTEGRRKLDVINERLISDVSQIVLIDDQTGQFMLCPKSLNELLRKGFSVFAMPVAARGDLIRGVAEGVIKAFKRECHAVSSLMSLKRQEPDSREEAEAPPAKKPTLFQPDFQKPKFPAAESPAP